MRIRARAAWVALGLAVATAVAPAYAGCDPTGADAAAVSSGWDAIDAACPCADALGRASYRRCATLAVRARVVAGALSTGCRRDVLRHAKLSVCGRPGTAVCCRVRADGVPRHRIVSDPAACVPTAQTSACVSTWQSVPTGCDATGCVPPAVCGNGVVERGEECDPPDYLVCSGLCRTITCPVTATSCGNGVVDPGEECEPPDAGNCSRTCQLAGCNDPEPGEIAIACLGDASGIGAAATTDRYLVGWSAPLEHDVADLLVRRFDVDGAPLDPTVTVVSDGAPCGTAHVGPALASDGATFYAVWNGYGALEELSAPYQVVYGRRVDAAAGVGALDRLAFNIPFGQCQSDITGPTITTGVSPSRFAAGWTDIAACFLTGLVFKNPAGEIVDLNAVPMPQSVALGYPFGPPPANYSATGATVASLGPDTLWAWHAAFAQTLQGPYVSFVASVWTDVGGSTAPSVLSARTGHVDYAPAVAAGSTSFLVAWGQGATDTSSSVTEIRGMRVTRSDGPLDPDGGSLLATAATQVLAGPVVAFDGARWLVVWIEQVSATAGEIRAVAVRDDGTVVDASPRLVASDVEGVTPALASAGDGRVLVVFSRSQGGIPPLGHAIRAVLVSP